MSALKQERLEVEAQTTAESQSLDSAQQQLRWVIEELANFTAIETLKTAEAKEESQIATNKRLEAESEAEV